MAEGKEEQSVRDGAEAAGRYRPALIAVLALLVIVMAFNQIQIMALGSLPATKSVASSVAAAGTSATQAQAASGSTASLSDYRPTGVPAIYGSEIGISYDDISASDEAGSDAVISKLASYDTGITLEGADLQRYISIGSSISCEYCCGATSLVFSNGQPACGCAHSYAMRGLAKYLIKYHGSEMTDQQILIELAKWKTLFFPGPINEKAAALKAAGLGTDYISLASNEYMGIENGVSYGQSGGATQVGGC